MARIRSIKPEFATNEQLGSISTLARLVAALLPCHADREGRLEDRPLRLKVQILPFDACEMDEILAELAAIGFIQRYEIDSLKIIQIVNFSKHQRPNLKEPPSTLAAPILHEKKRAGTKKNSQNGQSPSPIPIPDPDPSLPDPETKNPDHTPQARAQEVLDLWCSTVKRLPKPHKLAEKWIPWCKRRLDEYTLEQLEDVFRRLDSSDLAAEHGWADFEFVIKNDANSVKILSGKYDNHVARQSQTTMEMAKEWANGKTTGEKTLADAGRALHDLEAEQGNARPVRGSP